MINIPSEFRDFYKKNGYFIFKWYKNSKDNYKNILEFAKKIWNPISLEDKNIFIKDIKVNINWNLDSPATWNKFLWNHTDSFFRENKYKAKAVILFCINSWNWKWWNNIISNIEKTIEEYWKIYWEKEKNKILNTKIYFSEKEKVFKFWTIKIKIFQDFIWWYNNTKIFENWIFSIVDNIQRDKNLALFWNLLDKNSITLPILKKWDIIVINNTTFSHGRLWNFWNNRHLIRIQIK